MLAFFVQIADPCNKTSRRITSKVRREHPSALPVAAEKGLTKGSVTS